MDINREEIGKHVRIDIVNKETEALADEQHRISKKEAHHLIDGADSFILLATFKPGCGKGGQTISTIRHRLDTIILTAEFLRLLARIAQAESE